MQIDFGQHGCFFRKSFFVAEHKALLAFGCCWYIGSLYAFQILFKLFPREAPSRRAFRKNAAAFPQMARQDETPVLFVATFGLLWVSCSSYKIFFLMKTTSYQ
jgi:hypothetical protein